MWHRSGPRFGPDVALIWSLSVWMWPWSLPDWAAMWGPVVSSHATHGHRVSLWAWETAHAACSTSPSSVSKLSFLFLISHSTLLSLSSSSSSLYPRWLYSSFLGAGGRGCILSSVERQENRNVRCVWVISTLTYTTGRMWTSHTVFRIHMELLTDEFIEYRI